MSPRTRRVTRRITLQISTKVYTCRITFRFLVNMRLTRFATSTHKRYVKMTYPLFSSLPTQSGAGARMWQTPHNVIVSMSVVLSQMSCRPIALTVLRKVTSKYRACRTCGPGPRSTWCVVIRGQRPRQKSCWFLDLASWKTNIIFLTSCTATFVLPVHVHPGWSEAANSEHLNMDPWRCWQQSLTWKGSKAVLMITYYMCIFPYRPCRSCG